MVYPWIAGSLAALGFAWFHSRREQRGYRGQICLDCHRHVAADKSVCPHCRSVNIGTAGLLHARARPAEARRLAREEAEVREELERSGQLRGTIAFMPARLFWKYANWYMRGVVGLGVLDLSNPDDMRWLSSRLLFAGAFFASGGVALVNNAYDPLTWIAAGATLLAIITASVAIAVWGPRTAISVRWRPEQV